MSAKIQWSDVQTDFNDGRHERMNRTKIITMINTDLALEKMEEDYVLLSIYLTWLYHIDRMFCFMYFRISSDIKEISLLLFTYDEAGCVCVSVVKELWSENGSSKSPYFFLSVNKML